MASLVAARKLVDVSGEGCDVVIFDEMLRGACDTIRIWAVLILRTSKWPASPLVNPFPTDCELADHHRCSSVPVPSLCLFRGRWMELQRGGDGPDGSNGNAQKDWQIGMLQHAQIWAPQLPCRALGSPVHERGGGIPIHIHAHWHALAHTHTHTHTHTPSQATNAHALVHTYAQSKKEQANQWLCSAPAARSPWADRAGAHIRHLSPRRMADSGCLAEHEFRGPPNRSLEALP